MSDGDFGDTEQLNVTDITVTGFLKMAIYKYHSEIFHNSIGRSVKNFGKNDEKNVSNGITSSMMVLIWPQMHITLQWI